MNDRNVISDLFAAGNEGINGKRIVQCSANTLNTPYKAGLTGGASGTAYLNTSSATYGTILYIASGSNRMFLACKAGGTWGDWIEVVTNADIRIYGNSSFGYTPGIGSYLNDDNYRPRWARSGDNVVVYGVFAVGIAPTENKVILTGFPKPYSHTWISVFEVGTMIGREVYLNANGEIMSSSIPQGNYEINFYYRAK